LLPPSPHVSHALRPFIGGTVSRAFCRRYCRELHAVPAACASTAYTRYVHPKTMVDVVAVY